MATVWAGEVRPLVARDRAVQAAAALTIAGAVFFAVGPGDWQALGARAFTPPLAAMTAAGMWRIGADRRLRAASARFWLALALAMCLFAAGMAVDFVARAFGSVFPEADTNAGETLLYPIAGLFAMVALVVYPSALRTRIDRVKIGLDVAIVLFASATFVWYFLGSLRWWPALGWHTLADGLVLPGLTLVAGFAILRITLAGANVISRQTMICFVFAAAATAASIFLDFDGHTLPGRVGSTLQVLGLAACVPGVAIQRRVGPVREERGRAAADVRRPFAVLPYVALAATMVLLLIVVVPGLDYRGWVVAVGMLALCVAVVARQFASLWENSRLLSTNRELTGKLHHHAYHDHLTGLANRALFTERVVEALAGTRADRRRRRPTAIAVLFVDLDGFKVVNDNFGHHAGDELLVAVADRLRTAIRPEDGLCRLGGDEFAVLLLDTTEDGARAVAGAVLAALSGPFRLSDVQVRVEASVGIAMASGGEPSAVELLRNADVAMYAAKHTHEGGWRVFEPAMLAELAHRHELRTALARAVQRDEIVVDYQPIVDLATGRVRGTEAMARWQRPGGADVPADGFAPLAQEIGVLAEIDRHVLGQACRQAARWQASLGPDTTFGLHVNVSARHAMAEVDRALRMSGLPAHSLTLEITGSELAHHDEAVAERLRSLTRLGVGLAIDDFGTGLWPLEYLRSVPVDTIKIGKVFTDDLLSADGDAPLARALIVLASTLGLQTVAEGIERPEQARRLHELGCRYGQGPLFGPLMSAADMDARVGLVKIGATAR